MITEFVKKAVRFGAVGLLGTAVYFSVGLIFNRIGSPLLISHSVALVISLCVSYFAQKAFTFRNSDKHRVAGPRFAIATLAIVSVQYVLVYVLAKLDIEQNLAIAVSTLYYPPVSFLVHTFWTFRNRN